MENFFFTQLCKSRDKVLSYPGGGVKVSEPACGIVYHLNIFSYVPKERPTQRKQGVLLKAISKNGRVSPWKLVLSLVTMLVMLLLENS